MITKSLFRSLIFLLLLSFAACTAEAPITLTAKDRKLVDSLYLIEVGKIKPEIDSICESTFDSRVKRAVDSILAERRVEIEEQLRRIEELKAGK